MIRIIETEYKFNFVIKLNEDIFKMFETKLNIDIQTMVTKALTYIIIIIKLWIIKRI